jgi:rare lipoprotein A
LEKNVKIKCFRSLAAFSVALASAAAVAQNQRPASAPTAVSAPAAARADQPRIDIGKITYYGRKFAGRTTASGERFDPNAMTMAHKTLPFGTVVRVTNLANKRSVELRVNDRGPFIPGRVGDVSNAAAQQLRMIHRGVVRAKLEVISPPPE